MAPPVELREFYQSGQEVKPSLKDQLWAGFKTNPAAIIGGIGFTSMVSYAAYNFKNRRISSASMYVMHYRVVAQFMFIGSMGASVVGGLLYVAIMGNPNTRGLEKAGDATASKKK